MLAPALARPARASFLALAAMVFVALFAMRPAAAYYEDARVTGDEVRVTVDASGQAHIEHALTWRVIAGQPHSFDLAGTEPSAVPDAATTLESDDGRTLAATVLAVPGKGIRVSIEKPKALKHGGEFRVTVKYAVDLAAAGELVRDGSFYRLVWHAPVPWEGYERPKVTFALPAALEAPSALVGEGAMRDDGVASTIKRLADHDEVELVRPHVGRGEEIVWAVRVSAKAFEVGHGNAMAPPPPPPRREGIAGPGALAYGTAVLLALLFAAAVRWKEQRFDAACRRFGEVACGVIPLMPWERAAAAGAALFVGVSLQLVDAPVPGTLAVVIAMACAAIRPPRAELPARGPGHWLVLKPEDAFARASRLPSRATGALAYTSLFVLGVATFVVAGRLLAPTQPEAPLLLPLDALALVPLFTTGLRSQLPQDRVTHAKPWLAPLLRGLQRFRGIRVSVWARVPNGLAVPDELRLLVMPRDPMPGLVAIEIGFSWQRAATSFFRVPEVIVRVEEATSAAMLMTSVARELVPVPGRKPEERVYRILPRVPTRAATQALALTLARKLVDKRAADEVRVSQERRVTPKTGTVLSFTEDAPALA